MGLSKQSEKYWKRGETFGACVSQLFSRGKYERLGESVSQIYSEEFFLKALPFLNFFVPVSSRKKIFRSVRKSSPLCCSVHMKGFL